MTLPYIVTSSSTLIAIPNYGATDMSTWTAGDYVLDSPEPGVHKLLFACSSVNTASTIWASTGTSVAYDRQGRTKFITPGTTANQWAIELLGINTTQWTIISVSPYTTTGGTPQTT